VPAGPEHRLARCGVMLTLCLSGAGRCGFWAVAAEEALMISDSAVEIFGMTNKKTTEVADQY